MRSEHWINWTIGSIVPVFFAITASADEFVSYPFCGVTLIARSEVVPRREIMHIAKIDLEAPGIRLKLTPPGGNREATRQSTLDFLNHEHAQLAINAHFYVPFPPVDFEANLVGFAASEGIIFSGFEPQPVAPGYVDQSYAIVPYAPALNIDRFNSATFIHYDPSRPDNENVHESVGFWTALSGSAQIVSNGLKTIPPGTISPAGLAPLNADPAWYAALRARTAIGLTLDSKRLVLFTVDEKQGSIGMSVDEVADTLIRDYQVYNALNLDGDGSTTMVMQDPISKEARLLTTSADGPFGRAVGSNLAVFAVATPERVLPLSIVSSTNGISLSWPEIGVRWQLQGTLALNPSQWEDVHATQERIGDRMQVIVPNSQRCRLYRLLKVAN